MAAKEGGRGVLVCIEGIDGAGKATQTRMLSQHLQEKGFDCVIYTYPDYGSRYGKIIKEFLEKKIELNIDELFLLQILDKQKDRENIKSDLEKGRVVIADRYVISAIAYQSAGGFDFDKAKAVVGLSGLPAPDVIFYLDLPVELSMERKGKQKKGNLDRFEGAAAYLNKVRSAYNRLYKEHFSTSNWIRIEAEKGVGKIHDEIFSEIWKLLGV